jgi:hypothetical protein
VQAVSAVGLSAHINSPPFPEPAERQPGSWPSRARKSRRQRLDERRPLGLVEQWSASSTRSVVIAASMMCAALSALNVAVGGVTGDVTGATPSASATPS